MIVIFMTVLLYAETVLTIAIWSVYHTVCSSNSAERRRRPFLPNSDHIFPLRHDVVSVNAAKLTIPEKARYSQAHCIIRILSHTHIHTHTCIHVCIQAAPGACVRPGCQHDRAVLQHALHRPAPFYHQHFGAVVSYPELRVIHCCPCGLGRRRYKSGQCLDGE